MCRSPKLWIALAVGALALAAVSPNLGAVVPFLLVATCPLMMIAMMGGMAGMARRRHGADADQEDTEVGRLRAEVAELRQRVNN